MELNYFLLAALSFCFALEAKKERWHSAAMIALTGLFYVMIWMFFRE